MADNWSTVGWQGVSLQTPPDWNLVGVSGDEKKGYFRVDSPSSSAVEIRWSTVKKVPDLSAKAQEFLKQLSDTGRRRKLPFTSKVRPRRKTAAEEQFGGDSVGFNWQSDRKAFGRLLYCGYCKRLVIAQVVSETGADLSGSASGILGSICEHEEPGWNTWAVYDFQVPIPEGFRLKRHSLMSGFTELEFYSRNERLTVQRWGLAANTLLKKQSFPEWVEKTYIPGITGYVCSAEAMDDIHDAQTVIGRRKGLVAEVMSLPMGLVGKPIPPKVSGSAWFCEQSNKVYAVRCYHYGESSLVSTLREKIECH